MTNCIISLHLLRLPDDGIYWMQNCLTQKSLLSVSAENWQALILRNAWYSFVKRNYRHLFPHLCSRSRFNRTRRALMQTTELLRQKMISVFPFQPVLITLLIVFHLQYVNLGVHDIVKHFVVMVPIMENVLPKKKPITVIKYILWLHWKAILYHLKSHRHPQMTVKDYVIWQPLGLIFQF